jgi:hypothetical protein
MSPSFILIFMTFHIYNIVRINDIRQERFNDEEYGNRLVLFVQVDRVAIYIDAFLFLFYRT